MPNYRNYKESIQIENNQLEQQFYVGNIEYLDSGSWREIDPTFKSVGGNSWEINNAPYQASVPKKSNGNISFQVDDIENIFIPQTGAVDGILVDPYTIRYPNAFGENIHLEIHSSRNNFRKIIVIDKQPAGAGDLTFQFQSVNNNINNVRGNTKSVEDAKILSSQFGLTTEKSISNISDIDPKKTIDFISNSGSKSYLKPVVAWDADGIGYDISAEFKKTGENTFLIKTISRDILNKATYPLKTDATLSYNVSTEDNIILTISIATLAANYDWVNTTLTIGNAIADVPGALTADTSAIIESSGRGGVNRNGEIYRYMAPIDTSAISDSSNIIRANFHASIKRQAATASAQYLALTESTLVPPPTVSNVSLLVYSPTSNANLISDFNYYWYDFEVPSANLDWVNIGGWTTLGLKDVVHDFPTATSPVLDDLHGSTAQTAESANPPYLTVVYYNQASDRDSLFQTEYINTVADIVPVNSRYFIGSLMPLGMYIAESSIRFIEFGPTSCMMGGLPLSISAYEGILFGDTEPNPSGDIITIYYAFDVIEYTYDVRENSTLNPSGVVEVETEEFAFQNTRYKATLIDNKYYWTFAINTTTPVPEKITHINGLPMGISTLGGLIMNQTSHTFTDIEELVTMMIGGLPLTVGRIGNNYYFVIRRFIG
jgi:hypothetical protein